MRYAAVFAIILAFATLLFFGCTGQSTGASNLADVNQYSARINTTGIVGPYELHNAYSRHVFTVWSSNATIIVKTTTFTSSIARSCTNSTLNASVNGPLRCANTTILDNTNYTLLKSATAYNMTITTSNSTLNNTTGTFDIRIAGCNLNQNNSSDAVYVYLYVPGISDYVNTGQTLPVNVTNWTNITGLSKSTYVSSVGNVTVMFKAETSGAQAAVAGINIDYLGINGSNTYNATGGSVGNVTFQTSLDNRNWFTEVNVTQVGDAQRIQTNNTALYARFNVTNLTLTDPALDSLYIQYVAVSN
jgi:hypothetical protein